MKFYVLRCGFPEKKKTLLKCTAYRFFNRVLTVKNKDEFIAIGFGKINKR